jgi:hypothetical protein
MHFCQTTIAAFRFQAEKGWYRDGLQQGETAVGWFIL